MRALPALFERINTTPGKDEIYLSDPLMTTTIGQPPDSFSCLRTTTPLILDRSLCLQFTHCVILCVGVNLNSELSM